MFHAGVVAPSSVRLLQLLTLLGGDFGRPPFVDVEAFESENPEGLLCTPNACGPRLDTVEPDSLTLLVPLAREYLPFPAEYSPVLCGLIGPPFFFPPIALGNLLGCIAWALRLKDPIHTNT